MTTISREELKARLSDPNLILLEALSEAAYQSGHLPGARPFPLDRAREMARSLAPRNDTPIVVYCASETCKNSDQVAKLLSDVGYTNVRVYKGGKADWQSAGIRSSRDEISEASGESPALRAHRLQRSRSCRSCKTASWS